MKTNVADTSVEKYKQLVAEGTVGRQQARILSKMEQGRDYTRKELEKLTLLEINAITGRVNELIKKLKMLEEGAPRQCKVTGSKAKTVFLAVAEAG